MNKSSTSLLSSAKSLALNPNDPPMWQLLASHTKAVADAMKGLIQAIREKCPGLSLCVCVCVHVCHCVCVCVCVRGKGNISESKLCVLTSSYPNGIHEVAFLLVGKFCGFLVFR